MVCLEKQVALYTMSFVTVNESELMQTSVYIAFLLCSAANVPRQILIASNVPFYLQIRPKQPAPKMSSRKTKGKTTKKRAQRATSNVFAMFDQGQIQVSHSPH